MTTSNHPVQSPLVTVGLPVFNGERTLCSAIDSILAQSFTDFDLLISDNFSTDGTAAICEAYAKKDPRIRYVRQHKNIGASPNFRFVMQEARGSYFMWAAADDTRSADFIECNVAFLEANPDYAASTSPNRFEADGSSCESEPITFALRGDFEERAMSFMDNCWKSHAIFYSVMRTEAIRKCDFLEKDFLGFDWVVDIFLAKQGQINRARCGSLVFGRHGVSNGENRWRAFRTSILSWPFPFHRFSLYAWSLTSGCRFSWRLRFAGRLLKLNREAACHQIYAELFPYYLKYVRPWLKRSEIK